MRLLFIILPVYLIIVSFISITPQKKEINNISISNDTAYINDEPYCMLKKDRQGTYTIRSFYLKNIIQLTPLQDKYKNYYRLDIIPTNKHYYVSKRNMHIITLLNDMVRYHILEDNFFSTQGINNLIQHWSTLKKIVDNITPPTSGSYKKIGDWHISWGKTDNEDSTIVLVDDEPFFYYKYKNWRDYGDLVSPLLYTGIKYSYSIYDLDDKYVGSISLLAHTGPTSIKVCTASKEEFFFQNVPKEEHILKVGIKLLLALDTNK